jgi:hypothetical protein
MKHNIIKTENYLLVVDDSEIKYDDHFIDEYKMLYMLKNGSTEKYKSVKKVISHLPLNEAPLLEGVPLLPSLEIVRYDFAEMFYNICKATYPNFDEWIEAKEYNKAKEKYKYTEEDLRKAIDMARNGKRKVIDTKGLEYLFSLQEDEIIQSLQQPKMPVAFECLTFDTGNDELDGTHILGIRTTTNPQYQTEWVGKYIY